MPSGKQRKPTEIKAKKGTLRPHRLIENEFKPENIHPNSLQPDYLTTDYELNEWNRITTELSTYGILAAVDKGLIEAYCVEAAKYREAIETLKDEGYIKVGRMGDYINPWHMIAERSFDRMYKLGIMFGLTPSARAKVQMNKPKENKLHDLLRTGS